MFGAGRKDVKEGSPGGRPPDRPLSGARIPRVDFLVVGCMKCGTTTLREVLGAHPEIHVPDRELHFFGNHERYLSVWRGGEIDAAALHDAYGRHYETDRPVRGGKTPNYIISGLTIERIQRFHPQARIVVMVREPVSRARSHWEHLERQLASGKATRAMVEPTLAAHLEMNLRDIERARQPAAEIAGSNVLYRGLYAEQIRRVHRFFPPERVHVGVLDDLRDDPGSFFRSLFGFLGVSYDAGAVAAGARGGGGSKREPLDEDTRRFLREFYAPSVRELEELLQRELPGWK